MFRHIIVPMDSSTLAECVLAHTVALARAFEAEVTLLRVLEPYGTEHTQPVDPLDWHMRKAEMSVYLDEWLVRLQEINIRAQRVLLEGDPGQQIIEYAHNHDADLIVLSSHGEGGLAGWNIGSIARKVIMHSHISTMIVRAFQPVPQQLGRLRYRRLLVPLDGSRRAECVLAPAATLARFHESELLLAHGVRRPEMPRRTRPSSEDVELTDRIMERNLEEGQKYFEDLSRRLSVDFQSRLFKSDDVVLALHDLVEREAVDLTILCAHGYSGRTRWLHGRGVTNFIFYGTTPLLIVQDLRPEEVERTGAEVTLKERRKSIHVNYSVQREKGRKPGAHS